MIERVLVPMDDSEMAERALRFALEAYPSAEVTVLHVVGEPSAFLGEAAGIAIADDIEDAAEEHATTIFERAAEIADSYDAAVDTAVAMGHPGKAIVERSSEFDTVVMGSHGGSLSERLFIGNVAERVFRRAPVPVTNVR
ncbi:MAG TPA: universal stress protein [Halobacteriales archaeon]|nr:universal stress protein [Halobacteriales archaeon]